MNRIPRISGIVLCAALLSGCGAPRPPQDRSKTSDPFAGPKPVAVLLQTDPGLLLPDAETPVITIYEDGQVICLYREHGEPPIYFHKVLNRTELGAVKQKITSFGDYSQLKRFYDLAPSITGQPETRFYLDIDGTTLATAAYGLMLPETALPAPTATSQNGEKADRLPKSLSDLYEYLTHLRFEGWKPWTPKHLEVMIWPYDGTPAGIVQWPHGWPGLDSPQTKKRGDSYSIFLPGRDLARLRGVMETMRERGAVEIGGRSWAMTFRFVFPSEPIWQEAFKPKLPSTAPSS